MSLPVPYYQDESCVLYCADCRDILPELAPGSVDLVLTDPPYGIGHDTDYSRFGSPSDRNWGEPIAGDDEPFDPSDWLKFPCVLFGANYFSERLPHGRWIIWDKRDGHTPMLLADAEMAWHNLPGRSVVIYSQTWNGFRRQGEPGSALHPTQKPVGLMTWILERYSKPGDLVLDPYMGSGPVAKACQMTGRRYLGIEIEERYCAIAARRLAQSVLPLEIAG